MAKLSPSNQWTATLVLLSDTTPLLERIVHYQKERIRLERFYRIAKAGKATQGELKEILLLIKKVGNILDQCDPRIN